MDLTALREWVAQPTECQNCGFVGGPPDAHRRSCPAWSRAQVRGLLRAYDEAQSARLNELAREIGLWAEWVGLGDPDGCVAHLREEVEELGETMLMRGGVVAGLRVAEELADCAILVLNIAHRLGVDIEGAVREKYEQNKKREWLPPDERGVVKHKS